MMKKRFEGINRPQLIAALKRQEFACGKTEIAEALAVRGELVEVQSGENIIVQSGTDNDVYFLIVGVVGIVVNGAQIATRKAGEHVGEMAAIEPSLPRSATVLALEPVLALKISCVGFMEVGEQFPQIWFPLAQALSKRLYQRNSTISLPNETPKLFIISSTRPPTRQIDAGLCRSGGVVPVPARPGQQPSRICHRPHASRLSWRSSGMDRLYAAFGHRPRALRVRSGCAWWSNRPRAAAWSEARRPGDRRAGRLRHGAHAMSRPGAGFHCRRGVADHPVQHRLRRPDRGYPVGRHRGSVALPTFGIGTSR